MATLNGVHYSNTSGLNLKTNGTTQVNISTGGVIEFNQAYTFPTSDGSANNVLLTDGSGSLSFGTVPNAGLTNSSLTVSAGSGLANGGSVSLGSSVTLNVGAGTGIVVNANDVALDYAGTNNFIDSATNLEGTSIAGGDTIVYHDANDNNVKKGFVSDLPFSNNSGTVTSVAISGSDGIDVDSGSPITGSGTIALGLSNIPNSVLSNSSFTVNAPSGSDPVVPLGGTLNFTSSDSSVTIAGNSTTDTIDLTVGNSVNTYVTGGTFTSGTLSLGLNDGSSAQDITGLWSSIPNSALSNSTITINGQAVALGGTISVGDITEVVAGNGLTGGGNSGSVTLNVVGGDGITANANDIALDFAGTDNYILASGAGTGDIQTAWHIPVSDASNDVHYYDVLALPFSNNSGTVTSVAISGTDGIDVDSGSPITTSGTITLGLSNVPNSSLANSSVTVTGGNGLTGGGSVSLGSSVTLNIGAGTLIDVDASNVNVDLSELTTSTSNADGDFFVVVDSSNNQKKLTKANINNSGFNNDAGYITSAGNTNLYTSNGTLSAARTVTQSGNNLRFLGDSSQSRVEFAANGSLSWPGSPRVLAHADDNYTAAIETWTEGSAQMHIRSYDQGQNPVFFVDAQGNLVATSKAFDIPHPNPEKKEQGMRLKHGNLEGPEHGVYVRGRQLNDKEIELPEYWRDLVDPDSITVQLTSVGSHQNLYVKKIEDNVVYIGNGNLFSNKIDCYYFIQAERKDIDKVQVEYIRE